MIKNDDWCEKYNILYYIMYKQKVWYHNYIDDYIYI